MQEKVIDLKKQLEESFSSGQGTLHINPDMNDNKIIALVRGCMQMAKGKSFTIITHSESFNVPQMKQVNS